MDHNQKRELLQIAKKNLKLVWKNPRKLEPEVHIAVYDLLKNKD
jgi:hypothetical protein